MLRTIVRKQSTSPGLSYESQSRSIGLWGQHCTLQYEWGIFTGQDSSIDCPNQFFSFNADALLLTLSMSRHIRECDNSEATTKMRTQVWKLSFIDSSQSELHLFCHYEFYWQHRKCPLLVDVYSEREAICQQYDATMNSFFPRLLMSCFGVDNDSIHSTSNPYLTPSLTNSGRYK